MMNCLFGRNLSEVQSSAFTVHRKAPITSDEEGRLQANVTYNDKKSSLHVTSLLGMFLAKTVSRINDVYGSDVNLSFAVPPDCNPSVSRAIREGKYLLHTRVIEQQHEIIPFCAFYCNLRYIFAGCVIAGVDLKKVYTIDASDCLVATYSRKLQGLRAPEKASLEVSCEIYFLSL